MSLIYPEAELFAHAVTEQDYARVVDRPITRAYTALIREQAIRRFSGVVDLGVGVPVRTSMLLRRLQADGGDPQYIAVDCSDNMLARLRRSRISKCSRAYTVFADFVTSAKDVAVIARRKAGGGSLLWCFGTTAMNLSRVEVADVVTHVVAPGDGVIVAGLAHGDACEERSAYAHAAHASYVACQARFRPKRTERYMVNVLTDGIQLGFEDMRDGRDSEFTVVMTSYRRAPSELIECIDRPRSVVVRWSGRAFACLVMVGGNVKCRRQ